jgi:hypothetical protein
MTCGVSAAAEVVLGSAIVDKRLVERREEAKDDVSPTPPFLLLWRDGMLREKERGLDKSVRQKEQALTISAHKHLRLVHIFVVFVC